ncbi:uncharacterized protein LOC134374852 [Cynocephalus volans]|uniref:uncharacterized protein LOC134374852 n=1 Tax=Cynocephalus volans TaxID=110931 RepID=UPI002FC6467D
MHRDNAAEDRRAHGRQSWQCPGWRCPHCPRVRNSWSHAEDDASMLSGVAAGPASVRRCHGSIIAEVAWGAVALLRTHQTRLSAPRWYVTEFCVALSFPEWDRAMCVLMGFAAFLHLAPRTLGIACCCHLLFLLLHCIRLHKDTMASTPGPCLGAPRWFLSCAITATWLGTCVQCPAPLQAHGLVVVLDGAPATAVPVPLATRPCQHQMCQTATV